MPKSNENKEKIDKKLKKIIHFIFYLAYLLEKQKKKKKIIALSRYLLKSITNEIMKLIFIPNCFIQNLKYLI